MPMRMCVLVKGRRESCPAPRWYSRRCSSCLRVFPGREFAAPAGVDTLTADVTEPKPKRARRKKPVDQVEAAVEVPVPADDHVPLSRFVPTPEQQAALDQFATLYPFPLDTFQQEAIA